MKFNADKVNVSSSATARAAIFIGTADGAQSARAAEDDDDDEVEEGERSWRMLFFPFICK